MLRLTCRAPAGDVAESVLYALAVSMEVGIETGIQVYDQVRVRLAQWVPAAVAL
jgi:hypothetical protein